MRNLDELLAAMWWLAFMCTIGALLIFLITGCEEPPAPLQNAVFPCTCIDENQRSKWQIWQCVDGKFYVNDKKWYELFDVGSILDEPYK